MTGKQIRSLLEEYSVRPNRKLGQNFLCDPAITESFCAALNLQKGDSVVEVGPGLGALTEHVLEQARKLVLVEFDQRLAEGLSARFADLAHVEVICEDAVQWDMRALFAEQPVHLLGNLPYSCGTAIMRHLLQEPTPFASAVLMLQTEVAQRLCAKPCSKQFGVLTLQLQLDWIIEELFVVPPEALWPQPAVASSVISLLPRPKGELPAVNRKHFDRVIKQGFLQRRKQLKKALGIAPELWEKWVAQLGVKETVRAEELSLQQWIGLANLMDGDAPLAQAQSAEEVFDVVDLQDQVVSRATREQVHKENLPHRAVHGLIVNHAGDVLLQKRSHAKDKNPGLWDSSVAGHVDSGEDYVATVIRESWEEIRFSSTEETWDLLAKIGCDETTGWEFVAVFEAKVKRAKGLREEPAEVAALAWFSPEVIDRWIERKSADFTPVFLQVWEIWKKKQQ